VFNFVSQPKEEQRFVLFENKLLRGIFRNTIRWQYEGRWYGQNM